MTTHVTISPLTRIEGHLAVHTSGRNETVDGKQRFRVTDARCEGEMFRGIETILTGRDPLDAQQITQRICGVCPISHGIASVQAQEDAYGITPTDNGRLLQNLILAANYIQSHILHFYHLAALDFVDVTAVLKYTGKDRTLRHLRDWVQAALDRKDVFPAAPFLPRTEGDYVADEGVNWELLSHYVQALEMRTLAHQAAAVFGAKLPHSTAVVPGGCTQVPTMERILSYGSRLKKLRAFVEDVYLPDLVTVAGAFPQYWDCGVGYGDMLCYGVFAADGDGARWIEPGALIDGTWSALDISRITEEVASSRFDSASKLHPAKGRTEAAPDKSGAYSWLKAPRYGGRPMEVGPLARVMVNYHKPGGSWIKDEADKVLGSLGVPARKMTSVLGRHLARGLEAAWVARQAQRWLDDLAVDGKPAREFKLPKRASGVGLTEAPRGALGHWISIDDYKIASYQCVVPTTWNCSPRDDAGTPGPVEKALAGTLLADAEQPIELGRIVRSFDPCIACAVH